MLKNYAALALMLASLTGVSAGGHAQSGPVYNAMQRGIQAMRAGQLADAELNLREAVRLAPEMPDAHLDLGLILAREGKLPDAIGAVRQALILDPRLPTAHQFLGIFLFDTHQPQEGRKELLAELELNPNSVDTLTFLGNVDIVDGHAADAAVWLDRAYAVAPEDLGVLELRGQAHNQVAHDSYARMALINPNSWQVHRVQGRLFSDEGRHNEAIAEYTAALKLAPANPDLYEALGDEYRNTSQLPQARDAYGKELKLTPANPSALYNVGSIDVELGESAAGVALLQDSARLFPDSPRTEYYLGRGLAGLGRDDAAAGWLAKAAAHDHEGEIGKRAYFELARTDRKLHRTAEANAAVANYNRIRLAQEKAGKQQVDRFRDAGERTVDQQARP